MLVEEDMMDIDEEHHEPVYDDNEDDNDVLYGNGHETLVVRKSLLTPKGEAEDDWQRKSIFYTTCTITDKVYKMIIDSGSYKNVVFKEAVKKLQLKTEQHPRPYKLSLLMKGSETSSFQPGVTDTRASNDDDDLSGCTLIALTYHELANWCKRGWKA
ncbi:hypothetical protein AgCh_017860 [Apium graveolens]